MRSSKQIQAELDALNETILARAKSKGLISHSHGENSYAYESLPTLHKMRSELEKDLQDAIDEESGRGGGVGLVAFTGGI